MQFKFEDLANKFIAALLAFSLCGAPQLLRAQSGTETQQAPTNQPQAPASQQVPGTAAPQNVPQNPAQSRAASDTGTAAEPPSTQSDTDNEDEAVPAQPQSAPTNDSAQQQNPTPTVEHSQA